MAGIWQSDYRARLADLDDGGDGGTTIVNQTVIENQTIVPDGTVLQPPAPPDRR